MLLTLRLPLVDRSLAAMIIFAVMIDSFYSLRMHSSLKGQHLSGAEGIVSFESLEGETLAMLHRALTHERGCATRIALHVESLAPQDILEGPIPELSTIEVDDVAQGRRAARALLRQEGVSPRAIDRAMQDLAAGAASPGVNMRGAMLIDAATGQRLEPDPCRGIRVSRMDLRASGKALVFEALKQFGAARLRVKEALVLAAKVQAAPAVVAELCWSDDPSYVTGYFCSRTLGYVRITRLKEPGEALGGRVFFVNLQGRVKEELIEFLQRQPFWVTGVPRIHPPRPWRDE